jgi:hypothetical protein
LSQMAANQIASFQSCEPTFTPIYTTETYGSGREWTLSLKAPSGSLGEGTPKKLATAISEYWYQTELNKWNEWTSTNWGNDNATRERLRNSTSRQLSKSVFS